KPSRLKPKSTSAGEKVVLFCRVAMFVPTRSFVSLSPGHQATSPGGMVVQDCAKEMKGIAANSATAIDRIGLNRLGVCPASEETKILPGLILRFDRKSARLIRFGSTEQE